MGFGEALAVRAYRAISAMFERACHCHGRYVRFYKTIWALGTLGAVSAAVALHWGTPAGSLLHVCWHRLGL